MGKQVGDNVLAEIKDNGTLILTINLKAKGSQSKSGKSTLIATTRGSISIPGTDLKMGLNIYRPAK